MEILCRIVDKSAREDASKRGDVIAIRPDGWAWSNEELTNPDWRIIQVDILQSTVDALTAVAQNFPVGRFRRREWFLDFSQLPLPGRFTGPRLQPIISMTRLGFLVAVTQKPTLV